MTASKLRNGVLYRLSNGDLGRYVGAFVDRCYFDDIRQMRSIRIHQFSVPGGSVWLTDREVGCKVAAAIW